MRANAVVDPAAAPAVGRPALSPAAPWSRAMEMRIGIVPLPVHVLLLGLIAALAMPGTVSGEVTVTIRIPAERMELMPFAQGATGIGGALTGTAATVAMARFRVL